LTPDEARSQAKIILGQVEQGADPVDQRRKARAVRSFREVADDFTRVHIAAKRKSNTDNAYQRALRLYILPVLGSKRIVDVRRIDVARPHANLSTSQGATLPLARP
jgi:hypothetical protein